MAENLFDKYKEGDFNLVSAGTKLSKPEKKTLKSLLPGTENVITAMKEEGVDLSDAKRRKVTKKMVNRADMVFLVVGDDDPVPDYVSQSQKVVRWDVPDPKGESLDFTRKVRDIIKEKVLKADLRERQG